MYPKVSKTIAINKLNTDAFLAPILSAMNPPDAFPRNAPIAGKVKSKVVVLHSIGRIEPAYERIIIEVDIRSKTAPNFSSGFVMAKAISVSFDSTRLGLKEKTYSNTKQSIKAPMGTYKDSVPFSPARIPHITPKAPEDTKTPLRAILPPLCRKLSIPPAI